MHVGRQYDALVEFMVHFSRRNLANIMALTFEGAPQINIIWRDIIWQVLNFFLTKLVFLMFMVLVAWMEMSAFPERVISLF